MLCKTQWEELFSELVNKKNTHELYQITQHDNICITISDIEMRMSECGRCGIQYECIELPGRIKADYLSEWKNYSAQISQYMMHRCGLPNTDEFMPLFKGYIEDTEYCVCHWILGYNSEDENKNTT